MFEESPVQATPDTLRAEVSSLREKVRQNGQTLSKWGRMLNALLVLLEEKGITSKDEVTMKVYERLRDSGALE